MITHTHTHFRAFMAGNTVDLRPCATEARSSLDTEAQQLDGALPAGWQPPSTCTVPPKDHHVPGVLPVGVKPLAAHTSRWKEI